MRKERRKKNLTPRLCSIGEYSVRTEKKHLSAKAHIPWTHDLQQGDISSSGKQPSGPAAIYYGAGRRPARQVAVQSVQRQLIGEGSNVCNGGREQEKVDFESWLRPEKSETIIAWPLSCYRQHVDSVLTQSDSFLVLNWLEPNELDSTTTQLNVVPFNVHTMKVSEVLWCVILDPIDFDWMKSWSL